MTIQMKNLPRRALLSIDGGSLEVERIGKGRFTEAWAQTVEPWAASRVYLLVDEENDRSKELMALEQLQAHKKHIPTMLRIGELDNRSVYQTKYYFPLRATSKDAWRHFRRLEEHLKQAGRDAIHIKDHSSYFACRSQRFSDYVSCDESLPQSLRDAVEALVVWVISYDYAIEIAKRNLAVDNSGNLVLLDPCFSWRYIEEQNQQHMSQATRNWRFA